jgi:hypothetical protein
MPSLDCFLTPFQPSNSPSESPTAQECLPQARKVRIEAKPGNYLQLFLGKLQFVSAATNDLH